MIVGGAIPKHNERALKSLMPDPGPRDLANSMLPPQRGHTHKPVAETSLDWKARLEAEDAKAKAEDERLRAEQVKRDQIANFLLREQIAQAEAKKKEARAHNRTDEVKASLRAQTRLLRDQEEQRHEKDKRILELQVVRLRDKIEFDEKNAIGEQAKSARKREERRRRDSLRAHLTEEERAQEATRARLKKQEDDLRREELNAQELDRKLREKADRVEQRLRYDQTKRSEDHWAELEKERERKRRKAAENMTLRQERAAKLLLAEKMEREQDPLVDRVEHRPDPFTDRPVAMSPATKRHTHGQYRDQLDYQISVRDALVGNEKENNSSSPMLTSARRLEHKIW